MHAACQEPLSVSVESKIDTAWQASYKNNHLIADEWGAFGHIRPWATSTTGMIPLPELSPVPLKADAVLGGLLPAESL